MPQRSSAFVRRKAATRYDPGRRRRQTLELDDRYVSAEFLRHPARSYIAHGAPAVRENFAYSSDANPERLDARGLQAMLAETFA